jgi:hypothetical protein
LKGAHREKLLPLIEVNGCEQRREPLDRGLRFEAG